MSFQDNLRQFRNNLNISAKDFAAEIGIPYTKYIAYENKGVEPKYDTLIKIAAALHVSIDDLLGYKVDRLEYWLHKFPNAGLYAEHNGEDKVQLFINIGEPNTKKEIETVDRLTVAILENKEFIAEMEDIAQEAAKESDYDLIFSFTLSQRFLQKIGRGFLPQDTPDTKKSPTE